MNLIKTTVRVTAVGAVALCFSSPAKALVVDDFKGTVTMVTAPSPPDEFDFDTVTDDPSTLGGERDMFVERSVGGTNSVTLVSGKTSAGLLSYNEGSGTDGKGIVVWDGSDGVAAVNPVGLGGVDLTEGGVNDGLGVRILAFDDITTDIALTVYTDATHYSMKSFSLDGSVIPPTTLNFPFADFVAMGGDGGASFSAVGAIVLTIDITKVTANDLTIDFVSTTRMVPLPAAVWSGLPVLASLGIRLRRKKK